MASLDALAFAWVAPSDVDDPLTELDWEVMLERLKAYTDAHGTADVPKKYQADPVLGGWVAAVRRSRNSLGTTRVAQLEALGFRWQVATSRVCGSKWMKSYREVRSLWEAHGHSRVSEVLGAQHELSRWEAAARTAAQRGELSPKRRAHLNEIDFF